jgi:hypothetical protein
MYQAVQCILQFFLADRYLDLQSLCTAEESVHMLIQRENVIIPAWTCIINAVSEPGNAVIHRDGHILKRTIYSIIISKSFHQFDLRVFFLQ